MRKRELNAIWQRLFKFAYYRLEGLIACPPHRLANGPTDDQLLRKPFPTSDLRVIPPLANPLTNGPPVHGRPRHQQPTG
jgi:hypothetical protein